MAPSAPSIPICLLPSRWFLNLRGDQSPPGTSERGEEPVTATLGTQAGPVCVVIPPRGLCKADVWKVPSKCLKD